MLQRVLRVLCFIGLLHIRKYRSFKRGLRNVRDMLGLLLRAIGHRLFFSMRVFSARNSLAFDTAVDLLKTLKRGSVSARKRGLGALLGYWAMVFAAIVTRAVTRLFSSINYVAPALAAAVFLIVINGALNMTFALRVFYNGEEVGYIADESVFENAEKQMLGRIVFEDYIKPEDSMPAFTIAAVRSQELLSEDRLTDALIKASGNELAQATGLYVDNRFLGAVTERRQLLSLLEAIKNQYRSDEEEVDEAVDFVKKVEARDGLYPVTSIVDIGAMHSEVNREEEAQRIYTTVQGDAPIIIAQKNGIPYSQLKLLNPDIEKSLLVGQEILVQKSVPVLEVKVVRKEMEEEEVNFKIEQIQDTNQYQGYVKVTQKGQKGKSLVTSEVTYIDGLEVERTVLDTRMIKEPINEKVVVGGKTPLAQLPASAAARSTSSNIIWPVAGGYVSCGFYGYWGHTGMDIAANVGTAVYAAASGTVTKAVYNSTGYGYHIIISHGGGVETLYGHNSKLYVKAGDWVEQGQLIAAVGRTGRATGPHCHFEVRVNGKYMNPANYIGTRNPYS